MAVSRSIVGVAGEYAVASELSRRGWLATLTLTNTPGVDILARHGNTGRLLAVQVKAVLPGTRAFHLHELHEATSTRSELDVWFAFVRFRTLQERPVFHLVPAWIVAALLYAVRANAEKEGKRVNTAWRNFLTDWVPGYREGWDLLHLEIPDVRAAVRLPERQMIERLGRDEEKGAVSRLWRFGWMESAVDESRDHFRVIHCDHPGLAAVVGPTDKGVFPVRLIPPDGSQTDAVISDITTELDRYLGEVGGDDPWTYLMHHCGTAANAYSRVQWGFVPGGTGGDGER